ncbi:wax ester/triacylglycerol synthase family O-acyltransferase [Nocardioides sp. HDW12B]|uniref:WS/DGAT/MGAT family O-acyltransferase n=1 Tax=Nocardioides sp. HDW12B TaxID=2714939 RepID=UPI001409890F|nr:wax ester/triacylglycerol synthase family O-acyltransferase [Nocardioides sp. HDW12B]QIK66219.1 wax ester/triacylglycerol synthase family O-acyltransferase [Nocardioides sp. HDW12B]
MKRLSGLDASFLYLETSTQLLHVCGVFVLQPDSIPGGYSFATMRAELGRRVAAVPEFRQKLRRVPLDLDHPVWVDDTDFDIDRHVHRLALPAPGGDAELAEVAGHLAGIPLDRSRPLWEMWLIEGLADGRIAVFSKMHHATVDGMSGMNLLAHLCSLEPEAPAPPELALDRHAPGELNLLGRAVVRTATRPLQLAKLVAPTVGALSGSLGRARRGAAMAAPFTAPRTPFNGTISGHRTIAFVSLDLAKVKAVKNATGSTVNDVVLTMCGGALRRYLAGRDALPETSLLATVPVSVRDSDKVSGANQVSALFSRLGTDVEDPLERLGQLSESNRTAKDHQQAIPAEALQEWAELAAPKTFGLAVRVYSGLRLAEKHKVVHNLVISNVPGPPVPVYFMGALIEAMYPLGPIFHGAGLNITVISSNGRIHVGIIGCAEAAPDLWDLAKHVPDELEALVAACGTGDED